MAPSVARGTCGVWIIRAVAAALMLLGGAFLYALHAPSSWMFERPDLPAPAGLLCLILAATTPLVALRLLVVRDTGGSRLAAGVAGASAVVLLGTALLASRPDVLEALVPSVVSPLVAAWFGRTTLDPAASR